jgi:hypothetical protein
MGVVVMAALGQLDVPPRASSRPYTPLTVSIARAQVIAAVRVVRIPALPFSQNGVEIETLLLRAFKGSPAGPRLTLVLEPFEQDLVYRLVPGSEFVLFLAPTGAPGAYRLTDGTLLSYEESGASQLDKIAPLVPAWSDAPDGLASLIVPDHEPSTAKGRDPFRYKVGEPVLLWAGYRNVSDRDIELRYRDWPLESHTRWHLRVERRGAGVVAALRHPHVDTTQIREFFSRNGHRFQMRLRPGEAFFLYLDRINVAEPGWGYRERLDFLYYPLTSPGEYTITAVGRFYHPGAPTTSRALTVWVD